MNFHHSQTPSLGVTTTDFLRGMDDEDMTMASPALSLLDTDASFGFDSMFPSSTNSQVNSQGADLFGNFFTLPAQNMDTTISTALGIDIPLQNGAIGDRFYGIQQTPQARSLPHDRSLSLTSPAIIMGNEHSFSSTVPAGQYHDRDFINGGVDRICLQTSDELAHSGTDIDLMTKVSQRYNVQRPATFGHHMTGVVALLWGIATLCQPMGRNPPTMAELLVLLRQATSRITDGTAPQVVETGIDRPLAVQHLLMILHRYGLRNNEQYNLGIIQSLHEPVFGEARTYNVTLEGPNTQGSKTIWLYMENGEWYPLAPYGFMVSNKSYADVLKTPAGTQNLRPTTPSNSSNGLLHPGFLVHSTPETRSDAGSDATSLSCRSCGKKFDAQSELTHHIRNHRHRSLTCPHCPRSFLWNKDLKRHVQTHVGKETRMDYPCLVERCGKAYTRHDNLRRHHRQDHPNLPPLPPSSVASSHRSHRSRKQ